jgi:aryl-alcohol dehydrogenase-like predicted oxidoreductase
MERRQLGNTEFMITPIGLGAWAMGGGGWAFAWGPQDDAESVAAIHHALDLGINWIDTAAVYGLGHSEEVVARALQGVSRASRPYVFTKCSLIWDEKGNISHSLEPSSLRKELENSLRRLRVDTIDLYQIHWPSFPHGRSGTSFSDAGIEEAWQALSEMQSQGKIHYLGVSNFDAAQLKRIGRVAVVNSLQPPYSMLRRGIEAETLPYCAGHKIGVIPYSPMQSGLLSGAMTRERIASFPKDDWRQMSPEFQEPRLTQNLQLVEQLRVLGARHGKSAAEVAVAWTLRLPAITGVIVGARRPAQVDGFIGAAGFHLDAQELGEIDQALASRG